MQYTAARRSYTELTPLHVCSAAGHMVPQTNPREALDMFARFLAAQPLTSNKKLA
jgi:carboxypeptidase C (cathepsin A)